MTTWSGANASILTGSGEADGAARAVFPAPLLHPTSNPRCLEQATCCNLPDASLPPKSPDTLPEVFVATAANSHQIRRMRLAGLVRKIRPRIFTRNLQDPPEDTVKRNLWHLTGELLPGAVVSHRTALELKPVQDTIFVTDDVGGKLILPGLKIIRTNGHGPVDGDRPFMNGLFLASRPRAFLENLQDSRSRAFISKGLKRAELESRLSRIAREDPANGLNHIRDEARKIAPLLSAKREFEILDGIIGAIQGTREAPLRTREALALRDAKGFDPHRIALFSEGHARLYDGEFAARPDTGGDEAFSLNPAVTLSTIE